MLRLTNYLITTSLVAQADIRVNTGNDYIPLISNDTDIYIVYSLPSKIEIIQHFHNVEQKTDIINSILILGVTS